MFSLFTSKKQAIKDKLGEWQSKFSKHQKAAIIRFLFAISKSDGHVDGKEVKYIETTALMLGIELNDSFLKQFISEGMSEMIIQLNQLQKTQKEWLVVSVYEILQVDGRVEDSELQYSLSILEQIGISEDLFVEIVQNAQLLAQRFSKE